MNFTRTFSSMNSGSKKIHKETFPSELEIGSSDYFSYIEFCLRISEPISEVANHSWEPSYDLSNVRNQPSGGPFFT